MKKINFPLIIGTVIVLFLVLVSFLPEKFTSKDPNFRENTKTIEVVAQGETVRKVVIPPIRPNKENIMGTDELGRDIYARLIYGARITLTCVLFTAAIRFLIAIPFGIIAGMGLKLATSIIKIFNLLFTAIPILIISFIVLNIGFVVGLQVDQSIRLFAIVLGIIGWSKLASQIEERTKIVMNEDFIEGETAVGKSKVQIALQNLLPHLLPSLTTMFFLEMGLVLFILAQLSILTVFLGPRFLISTDPDARKWVAGLEPEWGNIMSRATLHLRTGTNWIALYPAMTFALAIMGFNLTGEGLRIELEKKHSRVISFIRKTYLILSPRIYIQQVKRFRKYYKPVITKTLCTSLIITYVLIPPPSSKYLFDLDSALEHLDILTSEAFDGRASGFEGGIMAGDYIIEKLKEYGLEPYDGENYVQEFNLLNNVEYEGVFSFPSYASGFLNRVKVEEATITTENASGETNVYHLGKDFIFATIDMDYFSGKFLDEDGRIRFRRTALNTQKFGDMNIEGNYINVEEVAIDEFYKRICPQHVHMTMGIVNYEASFLITDGFEDKLHPITTHRFTKIIPFGELRDKLMNEVLEIEIDFKLPTLPSGIGRNIFGILPGKNWNSDIPQDRIELILIGARYDGIESANRDISGVIGAADVAINLEIARVLSQLDEPLEKTVAFAFWDNSIIDQMSGSSHYELKDRIFHQSKYTTYYLDIGIPTSEKDDRLFFRIDSRGGGQVETFELTRSIKKRLKQIGINHVFLSDTPQTGPIKHIRGNVALTLGATGYAPQYTSLDTRENVNTDIIKKMGQFYIDLITINPFFSQ